MTLIPFSHPSAEKLSTGCSSVSRQLWYGKSLVYWKRASTNMWKTFHVLYSGKSAESNSEVEIEQVI
jgi:hypothetical protein